MWDASVLDAMSHIDLFLERRRMIETVLDILDALAVRLNAGEPLPNPVLADAVELLREFEDAGYDAAEASEGKPALSACVAQHAAARILLTRMQWALESVERGEAGAVGAFVKHAREYVRLVRGHMHLDDRFFPQSALARSHRERKARGAHPRFGFEGGTAGDA
jgi:hemerythrin-like domain-containing protein